MKISLKLLVITIGCAYSSTPTDAQSYVSDQAVRSKVLEIRKSHSDIEKAATAEDLVDMIAGKNLDHVHDRTIRLLFESGDWTSPQVRIWTATALGEFRRRAAFATPLLIRIMKQQECRDESTAWMMRKALIKMEAAVPRPADCSKVPLPPHGL